MKELFSNQILLAAFIAWLLAQIIKVPLEFLRTHKWNWALLLSTGGMPSSHSALVSAVAHGVGLHNGFDSALFAVVFVLTAIVVYDATGIRRQAGLHAELINAFINDLATGHPIRESRQKQLKEILGHTPLEAISGIIWGVGFSWFFWWMWQ
jgi:acid phosphatase family membrane protein YuiD